MNPTTEPIKRTLEMPEPIPDSEQDRTEQAAMLIGEIRALGPEAWKEWTSFEVEVLSELNDGRACTRTRFKIVRDAYQRIKKKLSK